MAIRYLLSFLCAIGLSTISTGQFKSIPGIDRLGLKEEIENLLDEGELPVPGKVRNVKAEIMWMKKDDKSEKIKLYTKSYDSNGNLVKLEKHLGNIVVTYSYDSINRVIGSVSKSSEHYYRWEFEYNESGQRKKEYQYDRKGKIKYTHYLKYDSVSGKLARYSTYNKKKQMLIRWWYTYDFFGYLDTMKVIIPTMHVGKSHYNEKVMTMKWRHQKTAAGKPLYSYLRAEDSNKYNFESGWDTIVRISRKYDKAGRMVKKVSEISKMKNKHTGWEIDVLGGGASPDYTLMLITYNTITRVYDEKGRSVEKTTTKPEGHRFYTYDYILPE